MASETGPKDEAAAAIEIDTEVKAEMQAVISEMGQDELLEALNRRGLSTVGGEEGLRARLLEVEIAELHAEMVELQAREEEEAQVQMDVEKLSVKQLRVYIFSAGLSCTDCLEKEELRARARQAQYFLAKRSGAASKVTREEVELEEGDQKEHSRAAEQARAAEAHAAEAARTARAEAVRAEAVRTAAARAAAVLAAREKLEEMELGGDTGPREAEVRHARTKKQKEKDKKQRRKARAATHEEQAAPPSAPPQAEESEAESAEEEEDEHALLRLAAARRAPRAPLVAAAESDESEGEGEEAPPLEVELAEGGDSDHASFSARRAAEEAKRAELKKKKVAERQARRAKGKGEMKAVA